MKLHCEGREVEVFTISPRTYERDTYWQDVCNTIQWSEKYGCTGMLIFTGNDAFVEPWSVAQILLDRTQTLVPLVAVNPLYMHPFTAARFAASFAYLYQRRVFLNMVTGTALSDLEALGENLGHDERYERLREYIVIVKSLFESRRPYSLDGRYYGVRNLRLPGTALPELHPRFVIAGQSPAARNVCNSVGAVGIQMLPPDLERSAAKGQGIHFGLITRPEKTEAWLAAQRLFAQDHDGADILNASLRNTDSSWKRDLGRLTDGPIGTEPGYWLEPFRNSRADCPYFVAGYTEATDLVVRLVRRGIDIFVLDIPAIEEEYWHANEVFKMAQERVSINLESRLRTPLVV